MRRIAPRLRTAAATTIGRTPRPAPSSTVRAATAAAAFAYCPRCLSSSQSRATKWATVGVPSGSGSSFWRRTTLAHSASCGVETRSDTAEHSSARGRSRRLFCSANSSDASASPRSVQPRRLVSLSVRAYAACASVSTKRGTPDSRFAALARQWRDAGATAIGGCCRTCPSTIAAIRAAL